MTSVKDRIAALQKKNNSDPMSDHAGHTTSFRKKPLNHHNFQSMQDKISAAAAIQKDKMTLQNSSKSKRHVSEPQCIQSDDKRNKVAKLADNMKGLNMQAILGGHSRNMKELVSSNTINRIAGDDEMVKRGGFQRAVIARGVRRGRTISDSLSGIKLSTE